MEFVVRIKRKGFTLIEIMIVLVVLGLLIAVALPKVSQVLFTGKVASTKTTFASIVKAANNFYSDLSIWPGSILNLFEKPIPAYFGRRSSNLEFVYFTQIQLNKWNGPYMDGTTNEATFDAWGGKVSIGLVNKANFTYDGWDTAKMSDLITDARWADSFVEAGSVPGIYLHSMGEDTVTGNAATAKDDIFFLVTAYPQK
ncbi:MAG TPA: prepilin-type N-terminal cleavage/methylation domain-containing protein [Candidatus Wallbacteria bacterium]|nr:prepilin-type N-terminal cleavage/methylation domain-containing protein [Candidatus Wallbacteria bacterium]